MITAHRMLPSLHMPKLKSRSRGPYSHCRMNAVLDCKALNTGMRSNACAASEPLLCSALQEAYRQDLHTASFIWQADLNLDFQTTRSQEGLIQHVLSIGHADQQNVIEGIHAIYLCQQLIDNSVVHTCKIAGFLLLEDVLLWAKATLASFICSNSSRSHFLPCNCKCQETGISDTDRRRRPTARCRLGAHVPVVLHGYTLLT